jgi:two-component system phosphate regulon sensor histidine kinase PhoR
MSIAGDNFEHLSALIDEAVILLDASGAVARANDKAFALLGAHIAGYPLDWFLRHPDFTAALRAAQTTGVVSDFPYTRMDQVRRDFRIRLAPAADGHVLLIISDDTSQFSVDRIHSDFVANVSHELRSPLTALNGFIETLQDGAMDDAAARDKFLSIMKMEADRMQRLIDDLLSLSRVEAHEHHLPDGEVDLEQVLADTVSVLAPRARDNKIELTISLDEAEIAKGTALVRGAGDELRQVFQNLIENALRYGRGGSTVELRISKGNTAYGETRDDLVRVQVINQGETIAPEHVARLTERFYRIDKGRARQMGGTGLGLAIVKHIINRHRGRLRITSEDGETCFSVTLPRV